MVGVDQARQLDRGSTNTGVDASAGKGFSGKTGMSTTESPLPDSFADAPVAIDELRAERSRSAGDISPRSTLVALLRKIDTGEIDPEALVVGWASKINETGGRTSGWSAAGPDLLTQIGILQRTILRMHKAVDDD